MWWRRRQTRDENFGVAAGQRFRSVGGGAAVWEVETVARQPGDVAPHLRLHRVGVPSDGKTISLEVLRDRRFYTADP